MSNLREYVQDYTDEQLLEAYNQRSEYTEEAIQIFEDEITRRCLDITAAVAEKAREARTKLAVTVANAAAKNLKRGDFTPLDCGFVKADVLTANSVLQDSDIPYIIEEGKGQEEGDDDDTGGVDTGVGGEEGLALFSVLVYSDALDKARALIAEHFDPGPDGVYVFRQSSAADRLKAFNFSDVRLSEAAAREEFEVDLSSRERLSLVKLAVLLLDEAERIEDEQGRVIFFYDSMEPLVKKLNGAGRLTRQDFLTIIELCQVYCDDPRYDQELNQTASSVVSFFLG